jgi:hypothetical protein
VKKKFTLLLNSSFEGGVFSDDTTQNSNAAITERILPLFGMASPRHLLGKDFFLLLELSEKYWRKREHAKYESVW